LQHRDVHRGDAFDVPRGIVLTRACGSRLRAPGSQHADHDGIQGGQRVEQFVGRATQGGREDRDADRGAGRLDRVGECVREAGIAADLVGPVVQHADPYIDVGVPRDGALGAMGVSPLGDHHRLVETVPGEQHGVAQKSVQLREVRRTALGEVRVCLRRKPDGHRRLFHQFGAGHTFAAEHDQRQPGGAQRAEFVGDLRRGTEHPKHDHLGTVEHGLDGLTRRVAQVVGRE
jgi:hypothetical protein